ncbi:hypothetical protein [Falsihalocynthiibacter arcticus]|uniref:Peptidase C39 domain-containing protein n=1 Tax=Falsihalocynthiibacter arcticus TaxID=1579316 RepID=A0A126UWJ8_9RHOB|nr:hypothetical protein [Falsihalocynthiibacter arcticus]AML50414.1 hypothetical protein RC74_03275 [Falsihalocynthiibacter arcticus]
MMVQKLHTGAALIEPYQQGDLDSLCGLYAIINALRVLHAPNHHLTKRTCMTLFTNGIDALAADSSRKDAVYNGMKIARQRRLAKVLLSSSSLRGRPRATLKPALSHITKVEELDQILRERIAGREVLLALFDGRISHHSVIVGCSPTRIYLFDSDGMQFVLKRNLRFTGHRSGALILRSVVPMGISRNI